MILIAYGTRPEYIKIKPIIDNLRIPFKVLFTGQHKDLLKEKYDYGITIIDGNNRLDSIVQSCMNKDIFDGITHVLVQGDTTTVLAISLAAFHRGIKIIHLESGLRTWDRQNPYPEETNRQIVSSMTDIHLCPTEQNKANILQEKRQGIIHVVGNTVLDSIDKSGCVYEDNILVTLHRRENHHWIDKFFFEIDKLAKEYKNLNFVLPIHPNPNVYKYKGSMKYVNVTEPMTRDNLLCFLKKCKLVISDSGGIQEECSYLNKKVIVCRKVTERPESLGVHSFICDNPSNLSDMFHRMINNYKVDASCPYGDGKSTEKIINILHNL